MPTLPTYCFTGKLDRNRHIMAVTKHWSVVNRTRAVDHSTLTQDQVGNVDVRTVLQRFNKKFSGEKITSSVISFILANSGLISLKLLNPSN